MKENTYYGKPYSNWIQFIMTGKFELTFDKITIIERKDEITLMICQRRPRTRWGFPLDRSWASMLTTLHPIAWAELSASVRFSCFVYNVRFLRLITRSSMVSGHEWFTILLQNKKQLYLLTLPWDAVGCALCRLLFLLALRGFFLTSSFLSLSKGPIKLAGHLEKTLRD